MVNLASEEIVMDLENIQGVLATGNELFSTQPSNVCASTRITSRRVTNSNRIIAAMGREITLMNILGVTGARSWSGPGIERFAVHGDGRAVFGFDPINSIPTSDDLFGWVNNLDAFIKYHNVGLEKTQIRSESTDTTPEASDENFSGPIIKDCLNDEASKKSEQTPAHNEGAGGAKLRGVVHAPSLPQLYVNVDSKQAEVHV